MGKNYQPSTGERRISEPSTVTSELLRQAIEGSSNSFVRSLLERAVTEGVPWKNPSGWGGWVVV